MPDNMINTLINRYAAYGRSAETDRIRAAFDCALVAHGTQMRDSGEAYIFHPLRVAEICIEMNLDADSIIAAILHDTVEDTPVTLADVRNRFGTTVADIVDGLTKLEKIPYSSKEEQEMENLRKMFIAMANDVRVILVKLADRLHNMRTIMGKPDAKRRETALETMDVYSPIAHRLGMTAIRRELEDISLSCLDPVGYKEITDALERGAGERDSFIEKITDAMKTRFNETGYTNLRIEGRVKHVYSIYRKMYVQDDRSIDEVYDIYAVRIICDNKNDCYNLLGIIHDMYKPLPGRFKDYISTPKPNMYQSIHTTLIGRDGIPFEVQIRTYEMHYVAEYGVAAHWKYKQGITGGDPSAGLDWIRHMLEVQQESDAEDFLKSFKIDLFADEVFVFTPKGDVINLPANATPIDFAYAIHSAIGNRMTGARVNGKMVPIVSGLVNGDIVEIITTQRPDHGPSRDWLKIVKTGEARSKIKQWFKRERREENIQQGGESLERELVRLGWDAGDIDSEVLAPVLKKLSFPAFDDLLAAIGYGGLTAQKAANRIHAELERLHKSAIVVLPEDIITEEKHKTRSISGVIVEGIDNCLVKFARCCTPIPGDGIIGFITRGTGVSVHRADCKNVEAIASSSGGDVNRLINVGWADERSPEGFSTDIVITGKSRLGMLADITVALANLHVAIYSMKKKTSKRHDLEILSFVINVNSIDHLDTVIGKLKKIAGVTSAERR